MSHPNQSAEIPDGPGNLLIRASAGSGKTYCLSVRYLKLLSLGVDPEAIVALTFTRKAAGEFFSRIASQLADSASSGEIAEAFGKSNQLPGWNNKLALEKLKHLVWHMPHLHLGTLDQFYFKILSQFCFEYDVPHGFDVVDPMDLEREINRLLGQILSRRTSRENARQLLEIIKETAFGNDYSSISWLLKSVVSTSHNLFLECSDETRWGHPSTIWPSGPAPIAVPDELESDIAAFSAFLKTRDLDDQRWGKWYQYFDFVRGYKTGDEWSAWNTLIKNTGTLFDQLLAEGKGSLTFDRKKIPIESMGEFQLLYKVLLPVISGEWFMRLRRTKGLFYLLKNYEDQYDSQLRRKGMITFSDVLYLLSRGAPTGAESGGNPGATRILSMVPGSEHRLQMEFRMNSRFDHWLLDEFQDTSRTQWNILENLIDEVVQDPGGQRSIFVVGDIKQSIYGWRGGDYSLFDHIIERYTTHDKQAIQIDSLDHSYRSTPEIIDFVNRVFSGETSILKNLGEKTATEWHWKDHVSALDHVAGHVAIVTPAQAMDGAGSEMSGAGESTGRGTGISEELLTGLSDLVARLKPVGRGLSCAVLVRRNVDVMDVTRHLRECGFPVAQAIEVPLSKDNLLVPAILSLVQFLIHPEDSCALRHVEMTPLWKLLEFDQKNIGQVHAELLSAIHRDGLSGWVESIIHNLHTKSVAPDSFHLRRSEQLVEATRRFEDINGGSLDDYIEYIDQYSLQEAVSDSAIQVMTVHKAKGLGFDIVLMPQLHVPFDDGKLPPQLSPRDPDGDIKWISQVPTKQIAQLDLTAREASSDFRHRQVFESLCLFYVACTRAKKGLYLITSGDSGKSNRWDGMLFSALSFKKHEEAGHLPGTSLPCLFQIGSIDALDQISLKDPTPTGEMEMEMKMEAGQRPEQRRLDDAQDSVRYRLARGQASLRDKPDSEMDDGHLNCQFLFSSSQEQARQRGTAVHRLLEAIEWIHHPDSPEKEALALWQKLELDKMDGFDQVSHMINQAFKRQDFLNVFLSKDSHHGSDKENEAGWNSVCWREKAFEYIQDGTWISGIIDRVVLDYSNTSRESRIALKARIYDFKTDGRLEPDAYAHQMQIYAEAVCRLTGLSKDKVEVSVVQVP